MILLAIVFAIGMVQGFCELEAEDGTEATTP